MKKKALVLQGGALRCLFTAGVLGVWQENGIEFDCIVGTSAGALSGINYCAGQSERTAKVNLTFAGDERYMGLFNLIKHHSIFNFDFLFGPISKELIPFDWDAFNKSKQHFVAVSTDVNSCEPVYHEVGKTNNILKALQASSSMPLLSNMVHVDGRDCMDGGTVMPVAYQWALDKGYEKPVVVLTREKGYRKKPTPLAQARAFYRGYTGYPGYVQALINTPVLYNAMMDEIDRLEGEGKLIVVRPIMPVTVSRIEKDVDKLLKLYNEGRCVGKKALEDNIFRQFE